MNTLCHRKCDINDACDFFAKCKYLVLLSYESINIEMFLFLVEYMLYICSSNTGGFLI